MAARVEHHHQPRRRPHTTLLTTPTTIQQLQPTSAKPVALAWSPSGSYLAMATQGGPILLFYVIQSSGGIIRSNPIRLFNAHTADVLHLTFSPTDFLLSAGLDRNVRLWHANTAVCLRRLPHPQSVTTAAFHPSDDNLIVTGGCDGYARLWKPAQHICIAQAPFETVITSVTFTSKGHDVLVGTYDGRVHVLPSNPPESSSDDEDQKNLMSKSISTWPAAAELPLRQKRTRRRTPLPKINQFCIDPIHRGVVICTANTKIHELYEDQVSSLEFEDVNHFRTSVKKDATIQFTASLSPNGRFLISEAVGTSLRVVDLQVGRDANAKATGRKKDRDQLVGTELLNVLPQGKISCAAFATQGTIDASKPTGGCSSMLIAVGAEDGSLRIVETRIRKRK